MRLVLALALAALLVAGCLEGPHSTQGVDLPVSTIEPPTLPTLPPVPTVLTPTEIPTPSTPPPTPSPPPPAPPSPAPAAPSNLTNGGFEEGARSWTLQGAAKVDCASSSAGACSLVLGHAGAGATAWQDVPAGNALVAKASYKTRDPAQLHRGPAWFTVTIDALDAQGVSLASGRMVWDDSEGYDEYRADALASQVPPGSATVRITFVAGPSVEGPNAAGDSTTWLDEVVLALDPHSVAAFAGGGFEEGKGSAPEGWGFQQDATRDCSQARSGACSLRLPLGPYALVSQSFRPEGASMRLRYWERGENLAQGGGSLRINVSFLSSKGYAVGSFVSEAHDVVPDAWREASFPQAPIPVPPGADKVVLFILANEPGPSGAVWRLDDVTIDWGS